MMLPSPAEFKNFEPKQLLSLVTVGEKQDEIPSEILDIEFNKFERIDFDNSTHKKELQYMFPGWLLETSHRVDMDLFIIMCRYDKENNTFVTGCFRNDPLDFRLISYKRKWYMGSKWRTRKNTHPNGTPFVRIFTESNIIFVLEGQKDSLSGILLGLDFIMLPYAGYRNSNPVELQKEVAGRDVIFLVEDKAAYECMKRLVPAFEVTANSVVLRQLDGKGNKVDLSDYVHKFNNIQEVISGLQNGR